jgi:hypothetical protein
MARKAAITLVQLMGDLNAVRSSAEQMITELSEDQLTWSADDSSWSVAQCFEHLRKFDRTYSGRIRKALDEASPSGKASAEYRPSLAGRLFLLGTAPASRIPIPTRPFLQPRKVATGDGAATIRFFLEQQAEVADLVDQASAYDINSIRFPSPLSRFVRLSAGDGLAIVVRHEQRHVAQAQRQAALATGTAAKRRT